MALMHGMAKRSLSFSLAALGCAALAGCFQPMRPSPVHLPSRPPAEQATSSPIPSPVPMTAVLPKPKPAAKAETYSVVVNNVRVHELLFALARDARLNVDIHPGITGGVTLNAIDQTLPQLLNRIARQVDMRWELDGPNLSVMPDSPFLRIYKVDYVNMERTTTGTVSVAAQIATAGAASIPGGSGGAGGAGAGPGGGTNASTVTVRNTADNKFWVTLVKNVEELLRETDKILPGSGAPAARPAVAQQPGGTQGTAAEPVAPPSVQFREAASVIANPEAGVLSIRASQKQHEKIQEFLDQVMSSAKRQVLLEGTIVEVQLSNQYQQGIDWARVRDGLAGFSFAQGSGISSGGTGGQTLLGITPGLLTATPTGSIFTMAYSARNISSTIRLLESFGNVRVLSSPRLSALNNQTALLKVVENRVYFNVSGNITPGTVNSGAIATFTSTANVVPVGFVMNITPQISDTDFVTLNLKPTISRIVGSVQDPNPVLRNPCFLSNSPNCNLPSIDNRVPEIQTREMESIIRVSNGQVAVMGGLIQDQYVDREDSVPGVNRVPIVGNVFGNQTKVNEKTELVIFLRPVVVRDPSIDGDYRGYRVLLPGDDFLHQPNPGRPRGFEGRPE